MEFKLREYNKVKAALSKETDYGDFKDILRGIPAEMLKFTDDHDLDLIHHAILVRNPDCVRLLLSKGIFQELEQPKQYPYLHMAAMVESSAIINILLQERPSELKKKCLSIIGLSKLVNSYGFLKFTDQASSSVGNDEAVLCDTRDDNGLDAKFVLPTDALSAIDIAALRGNMKCLNMMLNSKSLDFPLFWSSLERAADVKSLYAVRFLLEQNTFSKDEISRAFKKSLLYKQNEFVDAFLQNCGDIIKNHLHLVLNGMNPFHVMYLYSYAFHSHGNENRYLGLKETTETLMNHGFPIDIKQPVGTYPLYSLIYSTIAESVRFPVEIPHRHLATFKHVLKSGVDCNYAEEEPITDSGDILQDIKMASVSGRELYRSAFHAFVHEMTVNQIVSSQAEFIEECFQDLIDSGACIDGLLLGEVYKALVFQHSERNAVNLWNIIALLLKSGADPNVICEIESHGSTLHVHIPTMYFYHLLCDKEMTDISLLFLKSNKVVHQTLNLLNFMDYSAICDTVEELTHLFSNADDQWETSLEDVLRFCDYVSKELELYLQPKSLIFLCQKQVWVISERKLEKLYQLNIPKILMDRVVKMFF